MNNKNDIHGNKSLGRADEHNWYVSNIFCTSIET